MRRMAQEPALEQCGARCLEGGSGAAGKQLQLHAMIGLDGASVLDRLLCILEKKEGRI